MCGGAQHALWSCWQRSDAGSSLAQNGRGTMAHSRIALVVVVALLSGCASVVKGSSQSIAITTPPTDGAQCTLSSSQGNWQLTSPGAVTVEKSMDAMQVRCVKPGW